MNEVEISGYLGALLTASLQDQMRNLPDHAYDGDAEGV